MCTVHKFKIRHPMKPTMQKSALETIFTRAQSGHPLSFEDIHFLLGLRDPDHHQALFQAARNLRQDHFDNKIFLYGFLYVSTFCRNDCTFCFFRRSNETPTRYRKSLDKILYIAIQMAASGVHLIDLTMGEDPRLHKNSRAAIDTLSVLVERIKSATGLPVMVSPGVVPDATLDQLARAGAAWYACYQETHNIALFEKLRIGQNYAKRLSKKVQAHRKGLLIEEGILCGIGESDDDIAHSFKVIGELDADQIRVMNFVPQKGTPFADWDIPDPTRELMIIAIMRLAFPDRLIPASLDIDGLTGLKSRLNAGANVVTSLVPPGLGLSGVAHDTLDIENSKRTVESVTPVLHDCGLKVAHLDEYVNWIETRTKHITEIDHNASSRIRTQRLYDPIPKPLPKQS